MLGAGDSDGSNSGGLSFVYTTNDVGCGFRNELWYESWQGVLFAFYDARARAFEASLFQSDLSVAESEEAAAFIESYERRDDLVLLVVTSRWFRMSEEHTLRDAVKRCGGSVGWRSRIWAEQLVIRMIEFFWRRRWTRICLLMFYPRRRPWMCLNGRPMASYCWSGNIASVN